MVVNIIVNSDYLVCVVKYSDDELGQMVDGFNVMLNVIELCDFEFCNYKVYFEIKVEERIVELKLANQELEVFSYLVFYDLCFLLWVIDGFSQVLFEDYVELLDFMVMSYFEWVCMVSQ